MLYLLTYTYHKNIIGTSIYEG